MGEAEVTEARWNFYKLQGEQARRAGIRRDRNPFLNKPSQRDESAAWESGWESEDDARRRK